MFNSIGISRSEQPRVVAVTCMIEKEFIAKAYKSGIDQIIPKPLSMQQFANLLLELKLINEIPRYLYDMPHFRD